MPTHPISVPFSKSKMVNVKVNGVGYSSLQQASSLRELNTFANLRYINVLNNNNNINKQQHCAPLILAGIAFKFVSSVRYLGVYLMTGTKWKLSVDHVKLNFYRVFNCIYSRCKSQNSELVTVELLKSYCLPFLLYASEAVSLSIGNIHSLDNCLNRAVHRIFNVNASDGIADIRRFIGLYKLENTIENRCAKFYDQLLCNSDDLICFC